MGIFRRKGDGFRGQFDSDSGGKSTSNQQVILPVGGGAPPSRPPKTLFDRIQQVSFFFLVLIIGVAVVYALFASVYRAGQATLDRDLPEMSTPRVALENSMRLNQNVLRDWTVYTRQIHVIDRKIGSLSLADSLIGDPSDHVLLGIFERDRVRRKSEAAMHFYLAAANGHPDAYRLYKELNVPTEDFEALYQQFVSIHQANGDLGLMRLGQYYLGADAFKVARRMRTRLRFETDNDFLWPRQRQAEELAYTSFQMASLCGLPSAFEWRAETARYYNFTTQRENALKQRANSELRGLAQRFGVSQDDFCQRFHLVDVLDSFREYYSNRVVVQNENLLQGWDGRSNPCELEIGNFSDDECDAFDAVVRGGYSGVNSNVPTFRDLLTLLEDPYSDTYRGGGRNGGGDDRTSRGSSRRDSGRSRDGGGYSPRYGDDGPQRYRNGPGAESYRNVDTWAEDGLPDDCVAYTTAGECSTRASALSCDDAASYNFNRGVADMTVGRVSRAREKFNRALSIGRECQSEYAELAAKRLAALNLTCEYSVGSLARISRGFAMNPDGGAIVDLRSRQRALAAKGYYEGRIDGEYGPATRSSIRQFQRELGFSETGDLTPIETVYLVCSAAQVNADAKSMNMLGIMYVAGLGVVQNTDAGLRILKQAAERGDSDAKFNLALIYGSGTVVSSYRLCGLVENLQIADAYLREAAAAGHIPALRLVRMFGQYGPTERWRRIKEDLRLNEFYSDRLEGVGQACQPNPAPAPASTP